MAGRRIVVEFLGKDSGLGKTAEGIETKTSAIGSSFRKVGAVAAVGLGIAGAAALKFGGDAIKSASDAQQSMGATETVFGKAAGAVIKSSEGAANAVGLSASAYRENANLIGSLFKNQGVATDQLAGKTDKMITLGADLAATFGGTTKESVEALGSAFKGEFDPLEKYGISLKQSTISAELAKRGQDKLTGAAATQAKQMVTTDLIMRQSKDSLGAFGRESDTLAGAQQRLGAKFEDIKAKLGAKLLPIVTKVVSWFGKFIDQMSRGEGAGGAFSRAMGAIGDVIRPIGEWIGNRLVPFIRDLAKRFSDASGGTSGLSKTMAKLAPTVQLVKAVLGVLWKGLQWAAKIIIPILVSQFQRTIGVVSALSRVAIWLWNNAFGPTLRFIVKGVGGLMQVWSRMLIALGHVPGFGWATAAGEKMGRAADKAWGLANGIRNIPDRKTVTVTYNEKVNQDRRADGIRAGYGVNIAGARARGGPVAARAAYLVGERGPEIFSPGSSGRIIPNHKAASAMSSGGAGVTINFNGLVTNPKAAAQEVRKVLLDLKRANGGAGLGLA